MKSIIRLLPVSLRSQVRDKLSRLPLGRFIIDSYYRGLDTQARYLLANSANKRKFLELNKGLPDYQLAITPEIVLSIPPVARDAFGHFTNFDPEVVEEMQSFIRLTSGMSVFLDVGAHFGIFSLVFASKSDSIAYAIEPSVSAFEVLKSSQALNPTRNIKAFSLALGDKTGKLSMTYRSTHLVALNTLIDNSDDTAHETVEIDLTTIDSFVENQNISPHAIKIDVEGYELPVLRGAGKFLNSHSPLIFLEVHTRDEKYISDYTVTDLVDFLHSHGYYLYDTNCKRIKNPLQFLRILRRIICSKEKSLL